MSNIRQLLAAAFVILFLGLGASILKSQAVEQEVTTAKAADARYRTLFRQEVEEIGGHEKGTLLRVNSTKTLQDGLNALLADGWTLVAVDGGRSVPLTGPHQMKVNYPPVYIFKRSSL